MTSNLPVQKLMRGLNSEQLANAILDRLTHRCRILRASGQSFQLQNARRRKSPTDPIVLNLVLENADQKIRLYDEAQTRNQTWYPRSHRVANLKHHLRKSLSNIPKLSILWRLVTFQREIQVTAFCNASARTYVQDRHRTESSDG